MNTIVLKGEESYPYGYLTPVPVGQANFSTLKIVPDELWKDFIITVQFIQEDTILNRLVGADLTCKFPSELKEGTVELAFRGDNYDGQVIATTNRIEIEMIPGRQLGGQVPPEQDLYQELIKVLQKAPILSESGTWMIYDPDLKEYVDTGKPSQGEDGYTPVRGKDYWTEEDIKRLEGYVSQASGFAGEAKKSADSAKESLDGANEAKNSANSSATQAQQFSNQASTSAFESLQALEGARQSANEARQSASKAEEQAISLLDMVAIKDTLTGGAVAGDFIGGTPILDYRIDIEAKQEGEGEPSPDNIRAINGVDAVNLIECGKNLFNIEDLLSLSSYTEENGEYTFTVVPDMYNKGVSFSYPNRIRISLDWMGVSGSNLRVKVFYTDGTAGDISNGIGSGVWIHNTGVTKENKVVRAIGVNWTSYGVFVIRNFIVTEYATNEVEYEPYNGTTHNIALPDTSYGGYIDWKRGKYVRTHNIKKFAGDEVFNTYSNNDNYDIYFIHNLDNISSSDKGSCSHLKTLTKETGGINSINLKENIYAWYLKTGKTVDEFKAYLAEQYTAGTPFTVVYGLSTPIEYDLADLPQLTALDGKTTIYSDAKAVTVTGYMDTKKYIERIKSELTALTLEV